MGSMQRGMNEPSSGHRRLSGGTGKPSRKSDKRPGKRNLLHSSFEIGILLKGIDGVLEIIGGFLLMAVSPDALGKLVRLLTQHELTEDPNDFVMNFLLKASGGYTASAQQFGILYLLTHGLIKIFLVVLLWRRKIWAYPLAIVFLSVFIVYQLYRFSSTRAVSLIALSVFDALIVYLTVNEYRRLKSTPPV